MPTDPNPGLVAFSPEDLEQLSFVEPEAWNWKRRGTGWTKTTLAHQILYLHIWTQKVGQQRPLSLGDWAEEAVLGPSARHTAEAASVL